MVKDYNILEPIINDLPIWTKHFKEQMGNELLSLVRKIFETQGQATNDTDPLNPRGTNPAWKPLSWITVQLKGSSGILVDTNGMINTLRWEISDSEWDEEMQLLKVGWFEDSGDYAYIAAIHEFGLTGIKFNTPDHQIMGGEPIGRTDIARKKIRGWFWKNLKLRVTGRIIIPERSMLRKAADIVLPDLENLFDESFISWLKEINLYKV